MIILLSPSKTINPKPAADVAATIPQFLDQSERLVTRVNALGRNLAKTLGVSDKIAEENRARFQNWDRALHEPGSNNGAGVNSSADEQSTVMRRSWLAGWTYRGETFAGLAIEELDENTLAFAQKHLLIVSGLYGLLRPQDSIMPYRLEMSTRLTVASKKNLYEFWGTTLADHIAEQQPTFTLNCASDEYAKAVAQYLPTNIPVITPKFLHKGKSKMAFAKFMRGTMARWAAEHKITSPADIRTFDAEGYTYDPELSEPNTPVFNAPEGFTLKGRWTKL